ncbi:MAG TPA: glycerophosphodiester phosphodiesterase [Candidatus Ornithospirochaeta avicola]|uniref:Glycerophosphodiester phosphodiesterase n=1 Tax=Candidatus Ornithospirochaeta avicola TaxID=2840896 RepID=A0A9D1PT83_9SPIO|nr:glycerophosphodiester phosphodiesterase [Candidatus Ornithospirochaeta avicola]
MLIYSHRGYSGRYPENTMLAFRKAVEAGTDAIELDVHLSKDSHVMIIHDESLERTAGVSSFVFEKTRSELESISAGKTQNEIYGFTPIPSFEEYLEYIRNTDVITNIELKTAPVYYPGIEEKVFRMVEDAGCSDKVIYSSFNWLSVMRMKQIDPSVKAGLLFESLKLHNIAPLIKDTGFDAYHPDFRLVDEKTASELRKNGVALNVWTVNEEEDIKRMISLQVDGIITNYPDRVLSHMENQS